MSDTAAPVDPPVPPQKALNLSHHLSDLALARQVSPLKSLYKHTGRLGLISFAGGTPHASTFPFASISAEIFGPGHWDDMAPVGAGSLLDKLWGGGSALEGKKEREVKIVKWEGEVQLSSALQYGAAVGMPPLQKFFQVRWMRSHFTARVYQPRYSGWATLATTGATDAVNKCVLLLVNWGDAVLAEELTFPGSLASFQPWQPLVIPVPVDGHGIVPEKLEVLLEGWDEKERGGKKRPHVLYTVPTGQNPTGSTLSADRKKAIYSIASKYDLVILEDDPYFFLQSGPYHPPTTRPPPEPETDDEFIQHLVPSFLIFDTEGRVIRIDTFSKTIAPGSRLGWVTANPLFIERLLRSSESSTQAPNGFGQALIAKLLLDWGMDGYIHWLKGLCAQYRTRRNWLLDALSTHFTFTPSPTDTDLILASYPNDPTKKALSFIAPTAGMFVYLQVNLPLHPLHTPSTAASLAERLWEVLLEHNVLVAPGRYFAASRGAAEDAAAGWLRLAFSNGEREEIERGAEVFAGVVKGFLEGRE